MAWVLLTFSGLLVEVSLVVVLGRRALARDEALEPVAASPTRGAPLRGADEHDTATE